MQVLGTVNIGQNIENAQNCEINNFQNSSQHKSTANVQPQIATPAETNSQATPSGVKAYKKDVFAALGSMLKTDFSKFQKNLSESKAV